MNPQLSGQWIFFVSGPGYSPSSFVESGALVVMLDLKATVMPRRADVLRLLTTTYGQVRATAFIEAWERAHPWRVTDRRVSLRRRA